MPEDLTPESRAVKTKTFRIERRSVALARGQELTLPVNERAGQPAAESDLVDVAKLVTAYFAEHPDPGVPEQRVAFGTSGHRGSALRCSFNDDHIAATTQAICDYRAAAGTTGPLYLGRDTHALSEPAFVTALEVLAANEVTVLVDSRDGYTPTPSLSLAILMHNADGGRAQVQGQADGIVITPSHLSLIHI